MPSPVTPRMKLDCLLYRHNITCAACRTRILPGDRMTFAPVLPESAGGAPGFRNLRPLHASRERPCDRLKGAGSRTRSQEVRAPSDRNEGNMLTDRPDLPDWPRVI